MAANIIDSIKEFVAMVADTVFDYIYIFNIIIGTENIALLTREGNVEKQSAQLVRIVGI